MSLTCCSQFGNTALHEAAANNHAGIVSLLVDKNESISLQNKVPGDCLISCMRLIAIWVTTRLELTSCSLPTHNWDARAHTRMDSKMAKL